MHKLYPFDLKNMSVIIYIMLLFINPLRCYCEEPVNAKGDIIIHITGLRNDKGLLRTLLFKNAEGFPGNRTQSVAMRTVTIESDSASVEFSDITFGSYAVSVLHDENKNGEVDTWFRLPKEGVGVSNNATSRFGPPKFDDAVFKLKTHKVELAITIKYLL